MLAVAEKRQASDKTEVPPSPLEKAKIARPMPEKSKTLRPKLERKIEASPPIEIRPVATTHDVLHKYRRNVTPSDQLFAASAATSDSESRLTNASVRPAISSVFLTAPEVQDNALADETASETSENQQALNHYLQIYSAFLQEPESNLAANVANPAPPASCFGRGQEISEESQIVRSSMSPLVEEIIAPAKPQPRPGSSQAGETKKSKRIRADQISRAFGGFE